MTCHLYALGCLRKYQIIWTLCINVCVTDKTWFFHKKFRLAEAGIVYEEADLGKPTQFDMHLSVRD